MLWSEICDNIESWMLRQFIFRYIYFYLFLLNHFRIDITARCKVSIRCLYFKLDTAILKFKNKGITFRKVFLTIVTREWYIIYEYSIERYFHTKTIPKFVILSKISYRNSFDFEASTDRYIFHIWKCNKNLLNETRCKIFGFQF